MSSPTTRRRVLLDDRDVVLIAATGNDTIPYAIDELEWISAPDEVPFDAAPESARGIACRYHPELFTPRRRAQL